MKKYSLLPTLLIIPVFVVGVLVARPASAATITGNNALTIAVAAGDTIKWTVKNTFDKIVVGAKATFSAEAIFNALATFTDIKVTGDVDFPKGSIDSQEILNDDIITFDIKNNTIIYACCPGSFNLRTKNAYSSAI